jgi:hypothetical protein
MCIIHCYYDSYIVKTFQGVSAGGHIYMHP